MKSYPCSANKVLKPFGHIIADNLYFDNENEVKKVHQYFIPFIRNKEERNIETKRES
jgi:hypothetical protein